MDIITGEKIQLKCHHYLGNVKDFEYNPKIGIDNPKNIDIEKLKSSYNNKKIVFCYTHILHKYKDNLKQKFSLFINPFVLVCHNSDHSFNKEFLFLFEIKNLIKIFSQNVECFHERLTPLPIGISNEFDRIKIFEIKQSMPISVQKSLRKANDRIKNKNKVIKRDHGNLMVLQKIISKKVIKEKLIYFFFDTNTNLKERNKCYQIIQKKGIPIQKKKNFEAYLDLLSSFHYAICPEGNGLDTHRFWECLYLGVIPIVKANFLVKYYSQIFPVIILNDWNDLDINKLKNKWIKINNKKLQLNIFTKDF